MLPVNSAELAATLRGPRSAETPSILDAILALAPTPIDDGGAPDAPIKKKRKPYTPPQTRGRCLWRIPVGERLEDQMLLRMIPGRWHGRRDIRGPLSAQGVFNKIAKMGKIQKRKNPHWRGSSNHGNQYTLRRGDPPAEPQYLFRLTPLGEACRDYLLLLR